ncbi:organellar oligopeptidase A, chloroplastic/mitochondrial-like [Camellia sinensis]|uniref:organellar oligopeptidase A, chloroplastic/mitochondrial-like n=1 Tax=Camellia sinensis TaxID=4442 RepID=UPI0010366CAF|nr:organellar oligopeptidase A, chloroplastic/mitochondrial-like [Camellia sinensis]
MALEENPLLGNFIFPPYDVIEAKHVRPAIRSLLNQLESDLVELETTVEPTWPKLVEPLEKILDRLWIVWGIVNHLNAVKDSPELRSAITEVQPEKVEFQLRLGQSKPIYDAFKTIRESSDWETLSDARKRVVEEIQDTRCFHSCVTLNAMDVKPTKLWEILTYGYIFQVSMDAKMATIEKAEELIEKLRSASWNAAIQDMQELKDFAKSQGTVESKELTHWDINFWSGRLRQSSYNLNEEELRPYFSLPVVIDGLFNLSKMLFDIEIDPADGITSVWNKDVRFYCVKNCLGIPIAYFYFDPYSRPLEKRGGAWMDIVAGRSRILCDGTSSRLPICHVVCNQTPPVGDKPSLMTIREVETVFHEFGHALQNMLTKQDEGLVSGSRGIEKDAVELASQFMENWCYQRDILMSIAKHYETGEILPEEVCLKIFSARTFRAGPLLLRQLRYASVDLELHTKYIPGGSESIYDIDQRVGKMTHVIPLLPEDRFLCSFSHIFADTYAAGYYSYQWAEVLSFDAFSAFEEVGLDNEQAVKELGRKFRETVLAHGGGKSPMEVFVEFRGREPLPDAFLQYNGLLPAVDAN